MPERAPVPRYGTRSVGETIASARKTTAGQAMPATARKTCVMACTSGWFCDVVPRRFQMKAMASQPQHLDAEVGEVQDDLGVLADDVGVLTSRRPTASC